MGVAVRFCCLPIIYQIHPVFLFSLAALDKDNQDAYILLPQFGADKENQAFFGVFDGHGKDGHYCARFARDNVSCVALPTSLMSVNAC